MISENNLKTTASLHGASNARQVELNPIDKDNPMPKYLKLFGAATVLLLLGFLLTGLLLKVTGHTQNKAGRTQSYPVTAMVLEKIDTLLMRQFHSGDWRYSGSKVERSIVKVYIQIPERLGLEKVFQHHYIKRTLCPARKNEIWQLIRPHQLQFNLYTTVKKVSVSANCT